MIGTDWPEDSAVDEPRLMRWSGISNQHLHTHAMRRTAPNELQVHQQNSGTSHLTQLWFQRSTRRCNHLRQMAYFSRSATNSTVARHS
jgi:hypothetical protein